MPQNSDPKIESETSLCPHCEKPVTSYWTPNGCLAHPSYVLIADWIFHSLCWEEQLRRTKQELGNKD